jgi:hypothetical protein
MQNYQDYSNTELLTDYAAARRELASVLADIREAKRAMEIREAALAQSVDGKNKEQREAALRCALEADDFYTERSYDLSIAERRKDELEAEVDILSKFIQNQQWGIRLRQVEALERQGAAGESVTDTLSEAQPRARITECALCYSRQPCYNDYDPTHDEGYICVNRAECLARQIGLAKLQDDSVPSDHMSNGNGDSAFYANKPRPQPTFHNGDEDLEIPF